MAHDRLHEMLQYALGTVILDALGDPTTTEVMVNADGSIWHERHGAPMVCIGTQERATTEAAIRLIATLNQTHVTFAHPSIDAILPTGERFKGFVPPRVRGPSFCIRKPQARVLTREDYVPTCCSAAVWDILAGAVAQRENLLLVGGMSSGKTTLLNALIRLIPPQTRIVTMEDTPELSVSLPNYLQLYTSADADLQAVVKEGFRTAAHRILVGEIRDGITAINTFKLWLGVGGGIATTHADSARDALTRLEYLCAEVSPGQYRPLLGEVIDLVVFMETVAGQRRVAEVMRINGWKEGNYVLETLLDRRADPGAAAVGTEFRC